MRSGRIIFYCTVIVGTLSIILYIWLARLTGTSSKALTLREFDYVVVGAGTAGCIVASLISKHNNGTVLLIEAGDDFGILSKIPLLTTMQQKGLNDWGFLSAPQLYSSEGLENNRQSLPRGKGLGGSSQLNYMLHFGGQPRDFDRWHRLYNLSEWRWEAMVPFLEAAKPKPHDMYEIRSDYSKITEALRGAAQEFRHKPWSFNRARYYIRKGYRHSVLHRFLQPASKHYNLYVSKNTMGKRIQLTPIDDRGEARVKSLVVSYKSPNAANEHIYSVTVRKELVLSAGAYQTPQLLLASGIGDVDRLRRLKIRPQKYLPGVGKNLHDHMNLPLFVSIDVVGPTINQQSLLSLFGLLDYVATGTGPLGNFGVLGQIFHEDVFSLTFFGVGAIDETAFMSISNFKRDYFRAVFPRYHNASQEGFVLVSTCLQPKSRGQVTVVKPNVRKSPWIDPNYLSDQSDVKCLIQAIRAAIEVVTSDAFAGLRPRIHWPKIKECLNTNVTAEQLASNAPTDAYLECLLRYVALGSHHPGGTCAMGATSTKESVVDAQLRAHGIPNLRLVDASVIPTPISGNPNSVIEAMAIRASTMILRKDLQGDDSNDCKEK